MTGRCISGNIIHHNFPSVRRPISPLILWGGLSSYQHRHYSPWLAKISSGILPARRDPFGKIMGIHNPFRQVP